MSERSTDYQIAGDHYMKMEIQPWDAMQSWSTPDEFKAHLKLTAVKYLARAGGKGPTRDDIAKARHYLDKWLEVDNA